MSRLSAVDLDNILNTSVGPGTIIEDLVDNSISGLEKIMLGNSAYGRKVGAMTATPEPTISREWIDLSEPLVGINASLKGTKQVQRVDVSLAVTVAEDSIENYEALNPGQSRTDWLNSPHGSLDLGAGNAAFSVVAMAPGVAGNSVSLALVAPGTASAPLTVAVTGNAITVNLATGVGTTPPVTSTAKEVVDAINAHSQASLLVRAGLPATSNGSGVAVAAASAPLAGGADGARIGVEMVDNAFVTESNHHTYSFVMESQRSRFNSVLTLYNCLQTEDYNPSYDDNGQISGISGTFMAHADMSTYDPNTGVILPPYRWRKLDRVL